jgi:hypothetical protein
MPRSRTIPPGTRRRACRDSFNSHSDPPDHFLASLVGPAGAQAPVRSVRRSTAFAGPLRHGSPEAEIAQR